MSLTVSVNGAPTTDYDIVPSNPDCTSSQGYLDCTFSVDAPIGNDSMLFSIYDQVGGSGNLLSTSTVPFNVTGGPQNIPVAMHAIIGSIAVIPAAPTVPLSRSALDTPDYVKLAVVAEDADMNQITDDPAQPVTYHAPITLTDRERNGSTTGLVVVPNGIAPPQSPPVQQSVTITDPSQDVYAAYFGNFIRAVAFDATSSDVTNPAALTPGGFSTDCGGQFAVAQSLPNGNSAAVRPRFDKLTAAAPSVRKTKRLAVSPVFGGGGSIFYDSNYLSGCSYDGTDFECNIEEFTPGECISMGMGYTDQSVPNDNEPLTWAQNGASNLITTITPPQTLNAVPTCYELYVPPLNSIGGSDLWQPDAGIPWVAGTILNVPVVDVPEGVGDPTTIDPSTYHDDLEDCVAGTAFPHVGND
jgi:hypothetical protein